MAAKEGIPANKLQSKIFFFHRIYQLLMFLLVVMSGDGSGHPINLDYKKVRDDCAWIRYKGVWILFLRYRDVWISLSLGLEMFELSLRVGGGGGGSGGAMVLGKLTVRGVLQFWLQ